MVGLDVLAARRTRVGSVAVKGDVGPLEKVYAIKVGTKLSGFRRLPPGASALDIFGSVTM